MKDLKLLLYQENISNVDKICVVVEEWLADLLKEMDSQASILCEKNDGDSTLTNYYAGQGMAFRAFAEEAGVTVNWDSDHYNRYEDD